MVGEIIRSVLARGWAIVRGSDGQEYFLHASAFKTDAEWNGQDIQIGRRVEFVPTDLGRKSNRLRAECARSLPVEVTP